MSNPAPKPAAIFVSFNPSPDFNVNLRAAVAQFERVYVIDNGSDDDTLLPIDVLSDARVALVRWDENRGIAAALNEGCRLAAATGYEWVVTFDQDSLVADDFVDRQVATLRVHPNPDRIAMIGAKRVDRGMDRAHRFLRADGTSPWDRVACEELGPEGTTHVITSGTLTRLSALGEAGGFRDDFFIDMVDIELCLRLRASGWMIVVSCDASIKHEVGRKRLHRLGPFTLAPTHHPALRRYYLFRNSAAMLKDGKDMPAHWRRSQYLALAEILGGILLFERSKLRKFQAAWSGVRDGIRGRMGKATRSF